MKAARTSGASGGWAREWVTRRKVVRRRGSPAVHGRVQGQPQRRRDAGAGGLVDGGVGQHHPGELLRMGQGPAEADHAAPVVADGDHRPVQPERGGEVAQVVDPVRQAPERAGALGEAHIQLVHGHHAPRMRGVGSGGQQGPPQVRPGRVAVHAQQGAGGSQAAAGELGAVVEQVPAAHRFPAHPRRRWTPHRLRATIRGPRRASRAATKRFPPWRCSGRNRRPCTARGPRVPGSGLPRRGSWAGMPGPRCPSAGT